VIYAELVAEPEEDREGWTNPAMAFSR